MMLFRGISAFLCMLLSVLTMRSNIVPNSGCNPYGLPICGGGNTQYTPYLFGNKEFEERQGLNIYDFGARTYAPDICRFWQPDPKAHDYHWLSPYAYCGGDPINFIDPTGEKIYYVDMAGRLITSEEVLNKISNRSEYETALEGLDRVVIIDQDGKIIRESDTFEEGTIQLYDNSQSELKDLDITLFEITGENAGRSVFETLSRAITARNGIEFGYIRKGSAKKGSNYVFTDHNVATVESMGKVFYYAFNANKQSFQRIIHSHMRTPEPSTPDKLSRNQINDYLKKAGKQLPEFLIYVSDVPLYINYTRF